MSRLVGPVRQIGHVVRDLDAALRYWTETLGVGPFFVARDMRFQNFRYMGAPAPSPCVSLALAYSGPIQIELIAQHDDTPSSYRDFLESGREGAQHVSTWFADKASYDRAHRKLRDKGMFVRQESTGPDVRFAYFSQGDGLYPEMEISEALLPSLAGLNDLAIQQAEAWDGRDPIRPLPGA
jgi:catechol 2,3-dioxygenase-like lactoylglutathione lyase family enzyme